MDACRPASGEAAAPDDTAWLVFGGASGGGVKSCSVDQVIGHPDRPTSEVAISHRVTRMTPPLVVAGSGEQEPCQVDAASAMS